MAKVTLPAGGVPGAFNDHVGQHGNGYYVDGLDVQITQLNQATLDAALITYAADLTSINDDFADKLVDEANDLAKDEFDDDSIVTALIKEMVEQLNDIRGNAGMPLLTFGTVNSNIRNRIGQP